MLADDLLMLLYDTKTGRQLVSSDKADLAIGGALLAELSRQHRIEFTDPRRLTKNRTIVVTDPTPTGDDVLDEALYRISHTRSQRAQVVVSKLAKGVRSDLLNRLTDQGTIRFERAHLAGIIPTRAWPASDAQPAEELKRELHQVLTGERSPTPRAASIISLLHAIDGTAKVLDCTGLGGRAAKRRAKAIAAGDTTGEVVRQALAAAAF